MLGQYLKIDGVQYPNPKKPKSKYSDVKNQNVSEAGDDLYSIVRRQKLTVDYTFQVTSTWREKILEDGKKNEVTLEIAGKEYRGLLTVLDDELLPGSEYLRRTEGLWTVKVRFAEF